MDVNTKNIIIAFFVAFLVFDIGSVILYSMKYKDAPKQYAEIFENWQGWVVIGLAIAAGVGAWYGISQLK